MFSKSNEGNSGYQATVTNGNQEALGLAGSGRTGTIGSSQAGVPSDQRCLGKRATDQTEYHNDGSQDNGGMGWTTTNDKVPLAGWTQT